MGLPTVSSSAGAGAPSAVPAVPTTASVAALRAHKESSKREARRRQKEAVEAVPAFEDAGKEDMLRRILRDASRQEPTNLIPADEHRALMTELKRKKAEALVAKAARWQATRQKAKSMVPKDVDMMS
eukprot:940545-Prymnesium_polylepis.1